MAKNNNNKSFIVRFLGNKNTVTIIGIIACFATLVGGYYYRVYYSANNREIAYAKVSIDSKTAITEGMIGKIHVSSSYISASSGLIEDATRVYEKGKYSSYKTKIPKGSPIFQSQLINEEELPDYAFKDLQDGTTIYSLAVTKDSTYANSIRANDYIDLYVATYDKDNDNRLVFCKFIEHIKVLAVKDSKGRNIKKNGVGNGIPTEFLFAVEDDMFLLLNYAERFPAGKITIVPVIRGQNYSISSETKKVEITSNDMVKYILEEVSSIGTEGGK